MVSARGMGLAPVWSVFVASALFAQESGCQRRVLPVSVGDRNGSPIRDLTTADFQAEFRGMPVKIVSVTRDTRPRRIVILLDASGSMKGMDEDGPWNLARSLAAHVAETRMRNTSVALLIFGDNVYEQHDFSQSAEVIADRLRGIASNPSYVKKEVRGRTALLDTIMVALRLLAPPRSDDVIYAISPTPRKLDEKERKALGSNLISLYRLMLENYLLEVEIPVPVDKWRRWRLEISKEKGRQFKDALVSYARELAPCGQ